MGYRTCHFSSLGVQGFLAEVAMGTTEIFKCPIIQRQNYSIRIAETVFNKADLAVRCSNLEEFFDVIDW